MDRPYRERGNYDYSRTRGRNRKWNNSSRKQLPYKNHYYYKCSAPYPPRSSQEVKISGKQSRCASPVEGSEEYMTRKIQQTSAIIMRHLLSPNEPVISQTNQVKETISNVNTDTIEVVSANKNNVKKPLNKIKKSSANAEEIYEKIRNYLINLDKTKMINFVNASSSSGLDSVINLMQKQQRLEISKILRNINSSSGEVTQCINSIAPDLGISIEALPFDVIEELRRTLNIDLEYFNESNDEFKGPLGESEIHIKDEITNEESLEVPLSNEESVTSPPATEIIHKQEQEIDNNLFNFSLTSIIPDTILAAQNEENKSITEDSVENNENSFNKVEDTLKLIVDRESKREHTNIDSILLNINIIDKCLDHLNTYKNVLIKALANISIKNMDYQCSIQSETQSVKSAKLDEDSRVVKKRKVEANKLNKVQESVQVVAGETLQSSNITNTSNNVHQNVVNKTREPSQSIITTSKEQGGSLANEANGSNNDLEETVIKSELSSDEESETLLNFPKMQDSVTAIKVINHQLLLGTQTGNIIFASLKDGTFLETISVTDKSITSIAYTRGFNDSIYLYIGSLEEVLRIYDFKTKVQISAISISDKIRCMDSKWSYVFMGCKNGNLIRYSAEKFKVDFETKNADLDILSLKTAQEGPRKVLIVGHREATIYVRDAMSGLFLRKLGSANATVYALEIMNGRVYCGTARDNVLVFDFNVGRLAEVVKANSSNGISCLQIIKDYLFIGCYNGYVYIFNTATREMLAVLKGPGGGIICMAILRKQIIVSTLSKKFGSLIIPDKISLNA